MNKTLSTLMAISALIVLSACGNGIPSTCEKAWDKTVEMGKKQNPNLSKKMLEAGREDFERRIKAQGEEAEENCQRQLDLIEKFNKN